MGSATLVGAVGARPCLTQQNAAREDASFVTFGPIAPGRSELGANERYSRTLKFGSNSPSRLLSRFEGVGFRSITRVGPPSIMPSIHATSSIHASIIE